MYVKLDNVHGHHTRVNVRNTPNLSQSSVVGGLDEGSLFYLVRHVNHNWLEIAYKGRRAYIAKWVIDISPAPFLSFSGPSGGLSDTFHTADPNTIEQFRLLFEEGESVPWSSRNGFYKTRSERNMGVFQWVDPTQYIHRYFAYSKMYWRDGSTPSLVLKASSGFAFQAGYESRPSVHAEYGARVMTNDFEREIVERILNDRDRPYDLRHD